MDARALFDAAFGLGVRVSALLALTTVAVLLLRRASAATRHLVAVAGLAGALALPLLSGALPAVELAVLPARPAMRHVMVQAKKFEGALPASAPAALPAETVTPGVHVVEAARRTGQLLLVAWVASAWLAVTLLLLARLAAGLFRLARLDRDASSEPGLAADVARCSAALGLRRFVRLVRSPEAQVPMTAGVLDPVVILPESSSAWSAERRRFVLLHELAHVKRLDWLSLLVSELAAALWWFHPLAWVALRSARLEAEKATDDLVLRAGEKPSAYAGHLIDIVRSMRGEPSVVGAMPMARPSDLEGRLRALLDRSGHGPASFAGRALAGTLVAAAFALAVVQPVRAAQLDDTDCPTQHRAAVAPRALLDATPPVPAGAAPMAIPAPRVTVRVAPVVVDVPEVDVAVPQVTLALDTARMDREQARLEREQARIEREEARMRRDELRANSEDARRQLERARAELEAQRPRIAAELDKARAEMEAQRPRIAAELERARAEMEAQGPRIAAELDKARAEMEAQGPRIAAELDKARAEMERQRPAIARAWDRARVELSRMKSKLVAGNRFTWGGDDDYSRANELHRRGQYKEAIAAFQRAIAHGEREEASTYNIACGYARLGDKDRAFEWLGKARDLGFDLSDLLDRDDDLDSLRQDPRFARLRADVRADEGRGEGQRAVSRFEKLQKSAPRSEEPWAAAGKDLLRAGEYATAARAFEEAASRSTHPGTSLYNAACALSLKGDKRAALDMLEKALDAGFDNARLLATDDDLDNVRNEPRFAELQKMADDLRMPQGRWGALFGGKAGSDDPTTRLEEYTRSHPTSGRAFFSLGYARLERNELDAAARAFGRALELGYRKATTLYNLACVEARRDDKDRAFRYLDQAIEAGFDAAGQLRSDDDLDNLRGDPRFRDAIRKAYARARASND